jgi:hypothetical protein
MADNWDWVEAGVTVVESASAAGEGGTVGVVTHVLHRPGSLPFVVVQTQFGELVFRRYRQAENAE